MRVRGPPLLQDALGVLARDLDELCQVACAFLLLSNKKQILHLGLKQASLVLSF